MRNPARPLQAIFGMPMPPPFEVNTVPYHLHMATFHRRNRRVYLPIVALALWMIVINAENWITAAGSLLHASVLFFIGMRWYASKVEEQCSRAAAWERETQETMTAMAKSGLHASPFDVLDAIRTGPPAPGWKRKEWLRVHDELEADLRKQFGDDVDKWRREE